MSQFNHGSLQTQVPGFEAIQSLNAYIAKVYLWMCMGLGLTALTAFVFASNVSWVVGFISNPILFYGSLIGEFVLVIAISRAVMRLSFPAAAGLFGLYAVLNGLTLSVILLAYTGTSVFTTFVITAAMFGVMSVYGRLTRTDLTQFRGILTMGLIGVVVLSLVNLFLHSDAMGWVISLVGLFVFLGLTAYDMQKLKAYYYGSQGDALLANRLGLLGALSLYLDFINLFLTLLRLFGRRK